MGHINDTPESVTDAGQGKDYTNPPPKATLVLVAAPVDSSMQVIGKDRAAYDALIADEIAAGRSWSGDIVMYDPRRPLRLGLTYEQASVYNYARLTFQGRAWYLFIDDLEYAAMNTTILNTTVDPIATYPGWALGNTFIERSHAAVAASQDDTYGDLYCLATEPLSAPPGVGVLSADILNSDIDDWSIILISANDLRGNGSATPYFERHTEEAAISSAHLFAWEAGRGPIVGGDVYQPTGGGDHGVPSDYAANYPWQSTGGIFVPSVQPSQPSTIDGVPQGGGAYKFTLRGYLRWLSVVQAASWVIEGIVDYRLVPSWVVSGGGDSAAPPLAEPLTNPTNEMWSGAAAIPVFDPAIVSGTFDTSVLGGWRDTYLASIGAQWYRKLVTGAFTQIMVGDGESSTLYEPELMRSSGVNLHARTGIAHGETSIRLTADYNALTDQMGLNMAAGGTPGSMASGYGRAAGNTAAADLGLANSAYNSYLTREAMEYNMATAKHLGETKLPMNLGIVGVQSVMQGAGGAALAGFAGAGPFGAVAGAVVGGGTALVTGALSANSSLDMLDVSSEASLDIGSYQLSRNGIFSARSFRTWVQALRAISGKGAAGALASAWRFVTGQGFQAIIVAPRYDQARQMLSMWRRYGYMVNRSFQPSRLDVMSRFSYWKTQDAVILGNIPQADRAKIAAAFDRGVTVYGSLSDVGQDVSTTNAPVNGFSY